MNSSPLIDIQDITYTYPAPGKSKDKAQLPAALQNVSLQVQQGEYLVVLGHNGSGKSTLARHCNALLIPDSGRVLVADFDTGDKARRPNIRDNVGMIFQNPDNQIIATVVEDDVAWALTVRGFSASLIEERVSYALAAVGITDLRKLPPHRLSGGQSGDCRCAGIAATLHHCRRVHSTARPTLTSRDRSLTAPTQPGTWTDDYSCHPPAGGSRTGTTGGSDGAGTHRYGRDTCKYIYRS